MKEIIRRPMALLLLVFLLSSNAMAADGGILSSEDGAVADPEALLAEVAVFKGIREGLTLSFATCDITNSCNPDATDGEIQQLIAAIDQRIDGLSQRQQNSEEPAGLEDVLIAYVDERDGLSRFLEKLGSIEENRSVIGADVDDAEIFGDTEEAAAETTENVDQFDMFADEDEEL